MSRFFAYKVAVLPYIQKYGYKCGIHTHRFIWNEENNKKLAFIYIKNGNTEYVV